MSKHTSATALQARIHPEQPASSLCRSKFDEIWKHSVLLLQRGYQTGSIITVDDADAQSMGPPWTRRYVYNHSRCGICKGPIKTWDMANRTVYACETCQVCLGVQTCSEPGRFPPCNDLGLLLGFAALISTQKCSVLLEGAKQSFPIPQKYHLAQPHSGIVCIVGTILCRF